MYIIPIFIGKVLLYTYKVTKRSHVILKYQYVGMLCIYTNGLVLKYTEFGNKLLTIIISYNLQENSIP